MGRIGIIGGILALGLSYSYAKEGEIKTKTFPQKTEPVKQKAKPVKDSIKSERTMKSKNKKSNKATTPKAETGNKNSKTSALESKQSEKILVTIDGGSATKKSPVAKSISEKMNFIYFETGAIYRTVAYVLAKHRLKPKIENKYKIEEFLRNVSWKTCIKNRYACFIIDGEMLSDKELRSDELNATVAVYASLFESVHTFCYKVARATLPYIQSEDLAGLIAEGRTCGTQYFPEADLKFWFNASAAAKVAFRLNEEKEVDDPLKRDELDKNQLFFPLKEPGGAVRIWTHNRSLPENICLVSAFVEQKIDEKNELAKLKKK
ncbi:MAG: (d)CMP kinase [Puniceicoccales bacterium]|jgi:cytidylate kinase|nr:(d)CMP kinase [Puniceicoccales bacterium]